MKNYIIIFLFLFVGKFVFAQEKPVTTKANDTIKTEVINVVTSYTPKVTDAFKIKKKPTIKLSNKSKKRTLEYQIFPAPVASTFTPKKGTFKGVDFSDREKLYDNYLAVGFGNNTTPYLETFIHYSTRFQNDFGIYAKYISSDDPVENTTLNSSFSELIANLFYKQEDRYFDWRVGFDVEKKDYNWYGLPNINFNPTLLNNIDESQTYNYLNVHGKISFEDSYINFGKLAISYFTDAWKSNEYRGILNSQFQFPLQSLGANFNDITLDISLDYLRGSFSQSYENTNNINYSFFTADIKPVYKFNIHKFKVKLGGKIYYSSDIENNINHFLAYPDVQISYPIINNYATLYLGADGDLHTNTYKQFSEENPFISPTQFLTQTNEKYNFFGGLNGKLSQNISYNTRISYRKYEDKALHSINNSKSDGTTSLYNGNPILGYEYGNSFSVIYDDLDNLHFFGEIEWDFNKNLVLGANGEFNTYTPKQQQYAWNLPKLKSEIFAKYKTHKWYAGANIFFQSQRIDVSYLSSFPGNSIPIGIEKYFDVNINGGYVFNDYLSVFVKANNVLDNNYQRFSNYNVQGFQILGGVTYKFDF